MNRLLRLVIYQALLDERNSTGLLPDLMEPLASYLLTHHSFLYKRYPLSTAL